MEDTGLGKWGEMVAPVMENSSKPLLSKVQWFVVANFLTQDIQVNARYQLK